VFSALFGGWERVEERAARNDNDEAVPVDGAERGQLSHRAAERQPIKELQVLEDDAQLSR
jgi:hypothetical protein